MNPLVSIVIPTCNGARYLAATLESVFAQTFRDFEVIVVDDASDDDTPAVLAPYRERICLLRRETRGGPAQARNTAIRQARGALIAFQDADDLWLPEKLELQVAFLENRPEIGVVYADFAVFDESGFTNLSKKQELGGLPDGKIFHHLLAGRFIGMATVMVRKSCLDKVGLFDESLTGAEDYNLYLRLAHEFSFGFLDHVLLHKRWHKTNLSHNYAQMCRDEIANYHKIAALFPAAAVPIRKLSAHTYFRFGHYDFSNGHFASARSRFAKAIGHAPLNWRAYAFWAAATLPRCCRDGLTTLNRARKLHKNGIQRTCAKPENSSL